MKKIYLFVLLMIYLIGYLLCKIYFAQGMPVVSYTAGWLYRHSFMYTWLIVILLVFCNKPYTAIATTIGGFLGIVIGDVLGEWIKIIEIGKVEVLMKSGVTVSSETVARAHFHYGVFPIWLVVICLFLIIGLIVDQTKVTKSNLVTKNNSRV